MPQEIEIRFAGSERDLMRVAKSSALHGFVVGRAATRRLNAIYYDTPELVLAKAGFSLRVRKNGHGYIQTVKDEDFGALASQRHEYECKVPSLQPDLACIPDADVRERILALADGAEIKPMIETDILR